jgi:hypothetical protein
MDTISISPLFLLPSYLLLLSYQIPFMQAIIHACENLLILFCFLILLSPFGNITSFQRVRRIGTNMKQGWNTLEG